MPPSSAELDAFLESQRETEPAGAPSGPDLDKFIASQYGEPQEATSAGQERVKGAAVAGAGAVAGGTAGLVGARVAQALAPGLTGTDTKKALMELAIAMRKSGMNLETELTSYANYVKTHKSDIGFAEYLGTKKGFEGSAPAALFDKAIQNSGKRQEIVDNLSKRAEAKASALSSPFYQEAFKNKEPIKDTRLYDFFMKYGSTDTEKGVLERALKNTAAFYSVDPDKRLSLNELITSEPWRKDAWKRLPTAGVPDYLKRGEPAAGLQRVQGFNIETLDKIRQALWEESEREYGKAQRGIPGAKDYRTYRTARKELTDLMDVIMPKDAAEAWKKGREAHQRASTESELAEQASRLFRATAGHPADSLSDVPALLHQAALLGPKSAAATGFSRKLLGPSQPTQERLAEFGFEPGGEKLLTAPKPTGVYPTSRMGQRLQLRWPWMARQRPIVGGLATVGPAIAGALGAYKTFGPSAPAAPLVRLGEEQPEDAYEMYSP
jgi:hypothetical protein